MGIRNPLIGRRRAVAGLCLLTVLVLAGVLWSGALFLGAPSSPTPSPTDQGVVTHLVDGDTLDVRVNGVVLRVRLLNVDTPETKKPNTPVQCMGTEASARLAELAPIGSRVKLSYDVDRLDGFGRTLAVVTTKGGVNASETLAAEGLGVALRIGQNGAGYARVLAAEKQARKLRLGLFSGACGTR
jgi:micrococcal nuclease